MDAKFTGVAFPHTGNIYINVASSILPAASHATEMLRNAKTAVIKQYNLDKKKWEKKNEAEKITGETSEQTIGEEC